MSAPARLELDPYDWQFHEDPYPIYRRLRDEAPAYHNPELGFWALTRHADVLHALRTPLVFSNSHGVALEAMSPEAWRVMSFLAMDPPRHDHYRNLVSRAFTPRRVRDLEGSVRALASRFIDRVCERGECDFIADFAGRLPMDVVSEMLGVPDEDRATLRSWSDLVVEREDGGGRVVPRASGEASGRLIAYFREDVARRRVESGRETLTDSLIAAEIEGARLTDDDIVAFLFLMIIAGNETTTKLLGNALFWLQRSPEQRADVRADPTLIPGWAEETLRFDASSQILYRRMARDHEIHGRKLSEGEFVALVIGSANRDERVFEEPDRYDIRRDNRPSLAFGQGTHFCLGASLARLEARVSLEEIMRRMGDYRIDEAGCVRIHSGNVRGYAAMPMTFAPSPPV